MRLTSSAFVNNDDIPPEYTCDGDGISPPLSIADVPGDAQSLVLIVEDPDAPGGIFTHWVMWNIDPQTEEIEEDILPEGAEVGVNSSGGSGYFPPCPPAGVHRYIFTVYALKKKLDLGKSADKEALEEAMSGEVISQAELTGLYGREEESAEVEEF